MSSRTVRFHNRRGYELHAALDFPADGQPQAWALFAHCFTCNKNYKAMGHISRALARRGYGVLRFDFTGLGQSEGDFADTDFSSNVADLLAAAEYLEREHQAPALLVGHSLGGAAVLMAAPDLGSVRAVATLAAPAAPEHVLELLRDDLDTLRAKGQAQVNIGGRSFRIRKEFVDDLEAQRLDETVRGLNRALLVLHSPRDTVVGIDNASKIFLQARHPKSFVSLDSADHLLSAEADAEYVGEVVAAWARRYVGAEEAAVAAAAGDDGYVSASIGAAGFTTEIRASGHALLADEPRSAGGEGRGPSPYDLLSAGLGACTSMTLRMYADHKGWPLEAVTTRVAHRKIQAQGRAECEQSSGKVDRFAREIALEGALDAEQRGRLLEIAERCPVHKTLQGPIQVSTRLADGE
ncbi:bifunctional alpha/beta hydrolase/OsmC family protein [Alkalilimnicola sp. S0819]|uniref:bifunctional alpha/beta hydrolase/OsmC family protein n=1 Tax=Alkalilimnicola sp. S0819 TaxID=2613922 RepID=UPI0012624DCC|nr:bifunctional alpha/beta hydrolase/OsmC family protein [Alkalilimnicola sp. S0819]KAB7627672.1 OsmC family protein [Alkalilimnicola sp. S0819]MPQ15839.1 alpha/beta fold hydrolase [Alkalilimnicola sp. S0819]